MLIDEILLVKGPETVREVRALIWGRFYHVNEDQPAVARPHSIVFLTTTTRWTH